MAWRDREKLRFVVIGAWNTLIGYLCFIMLYSLFHEQLHYLVIGVIAHVISTIQAFVAYRVLVFRSRGAWLPEFTRFNISLGIALGYGIAALWLLVAMLHFDPLLAQGFVTVGAVIISYVAHRRFSFGYR